MRETVGAAGSRKYGCKNSRKYECKSRGKSRGRSKSWEQEQEQEQEQGQEQGQEQEEKQSKGKLVKLSGSPRKNERRRVGAHHELSNEKSITGGCAPNEYVRLAEWESCNCTVRGFNRY